MNYRKKIRLSLLATVAIVAGCAVTPDNTSQQVNGKTVCDSYLILSMCVQDLHGDGTVDMIYFTDTNEVFMYQDGKQDSVAEVMPFHRCAVPLDEGMQATTNRILNRSNLTLRQEMSITKELISNYVAAKPTIDACNARFEDATVGGMRQDDEFSQFEADWDTE
ncbi:MAG: hypothetical protein V7746_16875 [Halioglobus sp.]